MDDAQKTTVIATFSHRHDAEIASDRLQRADIRSFISADDAGGMHPHLQQTHGVKLLVLDRSARKARSILEVEDLLSGPSDASSAAADAPRSETSASPTEGPTDPEDAESPGSYQAREAGVSGAKVVFTVAVIILVLALLITALVV